MFSTGSIAQQTISFQAGDNEIVISPNGFEVNGIFVKPETEDEARELMESFRDFLQTAPKCDDDLARLKLKRMLEDDSD